MGDLVLQQQANPGAIGANLASIYVNLSNQPCVVLSDGVERPIPTQTGNDQTVTGNLTVSGKTIMTGNAKPAANGVPTLGEAALGFKELFLDYTNTATVGNVTINKASGRCIVAAAASNVVIACNIVTANSHVMAVASQADTTGMVKSVVPTTGNITINCVAPTANMSVDFVVFGAD